MCKYLVGSGLLIVQMVHGLSPLAVHLHLLSPEQFHFCMREKVESSLAFCCVCINISNMSPTVLSIDVEFLDYSWTTRLAGRS
uniref:Secreted protein n=1 Tax=Anguilla anguilla TaxID=7936 RepID=A0A0E9WSK9_ANGAN